MAENNIIGRLPQKRILQQTMDSGESEFIAIYGRRRVGKTYLIREFFEKNIRFEMIGIYDASLNEQLENFAESLGKFIGAGITPKVPKTWREAFQQLENFISSTDSKKSKGKHVIFLDELPWLSTPRSKFIPALQHFWNSFCSKRKDIILVVCGSAASWMIQNIVRSKGGLHNRLTRQIRLLPFNLSETKQYLHSRNMKSLDNYSMVQIYMAIGGVPYYLSKIEKGKSAVQVIDALCFADSAPLRHEYEQLYRSLFNKSDQHMKIELFSFIFGIILTLAVVIIAEHIYGKFFGNRKVRELDREVKRLNKILQKKDDLIRKSLHEIAEKEKQHDKENE